MGSHLFPRSQTLFGNALAGETLFRILRRGNAVSKTIPFPNRVWERGGKQGAAIWNRRTIRRRFQTAAPWPHARCLCYYPFAAAHLSAKTDATLKQSFGTRQTEVVGQALPPALQIHSNAALLDLPYGAMRLQAVSLWKEACSRNVNQPP
jgi:hypothetical protein